MGLSTAAEPQLGTRQRRLLLAVLGELRGTAQQHVCDHVQTVNVVMVRYIFSTASFVHGTMVQWL